MLNCKLRFLEGKPNHKKSIQQGVLSSCRNPAREKKNCSRAQCLGKTQIFSQIRLFADGGSFMEIFFFWGNLTPRTDLAERVGMWEPLPPPPESYTSLKSFVNLWTCWNLQKPKRSEKTPEPGRARPQVVGKIGTQNNLWGGRGEAPVRRGMEENR